MNNITPNLSNPRTALDGRALYKMGEFAEDAADRTFRALSTRSPRTVEDVAARSGLTVEVVRETLAAAVANGSVTERERGFVGVAAETPAEAPVHRLYTQAEDDAAVVAYLMEIVEGGGRKFPPLRPRIGGTGADRLTQSELNDYVRDAVEAGRIIETVRPDSFYDYAVAVSA